MQKYNKLASLISIILRIQISTNSVKNLIIKTKNNNNLREPKKKTVKLESIPHSIPNNPFNDEEGPIG